MLRTTCFVLTACFAGGATAQKSAPPEPAAQKKMAAPAQSHESAFKDYRPYVDPDVVRWRDANAEMGRLGGHMGHLPRAVDAEVKPARKASAPPGDGSKK